MVPRLITITNLTPAEDLADLFYQSFLVHGYAPNQLLVPIYSTCEMMSFTSLTNLTHPPAPAATTNQGGIAQDQVQSCHQARGG